jgi:glycosyltransferase involved in cell wall biosynthesis
MRICIGVHVHAQPDKLQATLDALHQHTERAVDLLLLPDGPDPPTNRLLQSLTDIQQSGTAQSLGAPACFNRLAALSDADVIVFLESGSIVGPGWLDHLLVALMADQDHGLAGPSTNWAWNEQGVFAGTGGSLAKVARTAEKALQRFGGKWRTLEPLHSLADFCYAVRREVVAAIGAADEAYGWGPCWEMDYNIRAARAGFRGVWAQAAYVYRSPFTSRRRQEEARCFQANKHRYQEKFCALHLRGQAVRYESHCQGDDCEHFAPLDLIQLRLPLPSAVPPISVSSTNPAETGPTKDSAVTRPSSCPLVSCIMPTGNRAAYVLQSIHYFQRQTYPSRELIIVDDGSDDLEAQLPDDPRIIYERVASGLTIGAKRNRACELARGALIAQWDDDDWYGPLRLEKQIEPLTSRAADISAFTGTIFFELDRWQFWTCAASLHRRLFVQDVHGGTLVFRRGVWENTARYPDRSLAEDAVFLNRAIRRGARLVQLSNEEQFIYLRHSGNAWPFACGDYLDPGGWQRLAEPGFLAEDRLFYVARSPAAPEQVSATRLESPVLDMPLVSCIMPTADRRLFVPRSIRYFLDQDYAHRELIIVDDGIDRIEDLIPDDPRIRYLCLESRQSIGAKRNLACETAQGEVVVHWDDDDWSSPSRVSYQVAALLEEAADVTGLDRMLYYNLRTGKAWQYTYPPGGRPWVAGNTLCYKRSFWKKNPFPNINVGEDTRFVWSRRSARIVSLPDNSFYVAIIHGHNVSRKSVSSRRWKPSSVRRIQDLMGPDWDFYRDLTPSAMAS